MVLGIEILNIAANQAIPTAHQIDVKVTGINPGTLTSYKIIDLAAQANNFLFSSFLIDSFLVDDFVVGSDGHFEFAPIAPDTNNFTFLNFDFSAFEIGDANFVFDNFIPNNFNVKNEAIPVYTGEATFKSVVTLVNNAAYAIEVTTSDRQIARLTFTSREYNPRPLQTITLS